MDRCAIGDIFLVSVDLQDPKWALSPHFGHCCTRRSWFTATGFTLLFQRPHRDHSWTLRPVQLQILVNQTMMTLDLLNQIMDPSHILLMGSLKSSPNLQRSSGWYFTQCGGHHPAWSWPKREISFMETIGTETKRYMLNVIASSWGFGSLLIACFADSRVFYLEWLAAIRSFDHSCLCTRVYTLKFQANKTKIFILLLKPTPIRSQPSVAGGRGDFRQSKLLRCCSGSQNFTSFQKREIILDQTRLFYTVLLQNFCRNHNREELLHNIFSSFSGLDQN